MDKLTILTHTHNKGVIITDMHNTNEAETLSDIYKSAVMGILACDTLLTRTDNGSFNSLLTKYRDEYHDIAQQAGSSLASLGIAAEDVKGMAKTGLTGSIKMKTMMDDSEGHMAEMMIKGSNMAIVDMVKQLNGRPGLSDGTKRFAEHYIGCEQRHVEELKNWL